MNLTELKNKLNPEQYRAVTTLEGALLIIAGAGSGKTGVITHRIAHMLQSGIPQNQILALTFTNKAAKEMQERIKEQTQKKLNLLTVSTFHAFGVKILRADIEHLGWRDNFSIYDETDRNHLIKEAGRELGFTADALDVNKIGGLFSNIKCGRFSWDGANRIPRVHPINDIYLPLFKSYQEGLKLYNAVDFDDLIGLPIKLFKEFPEVRAKYKERYKYIMVDEFQDTSLQQYEFMHLLSDKNVAVVGDDDQSIYSWRGANYENILMFERDFPEVQEIRLEQNYRSTGTILAAANGVIANNSNRKDKSLRTANADGKPIELCFPDNEAGEADFVADKVLAIKAEESKLFGDFGVLVRSNAMTQALEEAFLDSNIPYTVSGGQSFYQRKEIKDVISYLRVCSNYSDDINLLRIINTPRRGIGRKTIEQLNEIAKEKECCLWDAIEHFINAELEKKHGVNENQEMFAVEEMESEESSIAGLSAGARGLQEFRDFISDQRATLLSTPKGLDKKVKEMVDSIDYWSYLMGEYKNSEKAARFKYLNIEYLINSITQWENNPDTFDFGLYAWLNRITLLTRDDQEDDSLSGKVNLMTIHASKGLEFPVVFIVGCEEGIIPHARSIEEDPANIEEERRLFYVAITRAREKLFLTSCRKRKRNKELMEVSPSPFLEEIPTELVAYHEPEKESEDQSIAKMFAQMKKSFGNDEED